MTLLSDDERRSLVDALIDAGLDVVNTRRLLLNSVDKRLVGMLPVLPAAGPTVQLISDVQHLDKVGRLRSGQVPLEAYLTELLPLLAADRDAEELVRAILSKLLQRSTGAPKLEPDKVPELKEKHIHGVDDTVTFAFMRAGLAVSGSVVKLVVPRYDAGIAGKALGGDPLVYLGTGWFIAKSLVVTNHHVINARDDGEPNASEDDLRLQGRETKLWLDFDSDAQRGVEAPALQLEAWSETLDYAILRVELPDRAPLPRAARLNPGTAQVAVNIVQHPRGNSKRYGIRNNLVSASTDRDLRYFTDTDVGSSGSPVFNDRWEVVALHRGATFVKGVQFQGKQTAYVNVGTHLDAILKDIRDRFPLLGAEL